MDDTEYLVAAALTEFKNRNRVDADPSAAISNKKDDMADRHPKKSSKNNHSSTSNSKNKSSDNNNNRKSKSSKGKSGDKREKKVHHHRHHRHHHRSGSSSRKRRKTKIPATVEIVKKKAKSNPSYRDFSKVPLESANGNDFPERIIDMSFLQKVHHILSLDEYAPCMSWMPHGRALRVHMPSEFERQISNKYFGHTRYSCFLRRLKNRGFIRITKGPDRNAFYHELMLRGLPHLCKYIFKLKRRNLPNPDSKKEPDFYKITQMHPLPDTPVSMEGEKSAVGVIEGSAIANSGAAVTVKQYKTNEADPGSLHASQFPSANQNSSVNADASVPSVAQIPPTSSKPNNSGSIWHRQPTGACIAGNEPDYYKIMNDHPVADGCISNKQASSGESVVKQPAVEILAVPQSAAAQNIVTNTAEALIAQQLSESTNSAAVRSDGTSLHVAPSMNIVTENPIPAVNLMPAAANKAPLLHQSPLTQNHVHLASLPCAPDIQMMQTPKLSPVPTLDPCPPSVETPKLAPVPAPALNAYPPAAQSILMEIAEALIASQTASKENSNHDGVHFGGLDPSLHAANMVQNQIPTARGNMAPALPPPSVTTTHPVVHHAVSAASQNNQVPSTNLPSESLISILENRILQALKGIPMDQTLSPTHDLANGIAQILMQAANILPCQLPANSNSLSDQPTQMTLMQLCLLFCSNNNQAPK